MWYGNKCFCISGCFIHLILTVVNNAMVNNKKASKIEKFAEGLFVGTPFVEELFVGKFFVSSIILSHVITELSIILLKYLQFSKLHLA